MLPKAFIFSPCREDGYGYPVFLRTSYFQHSSILRVSNVAAVSKLSWSFSLKPVYVWKFSVQVMPKIIRLCACRLANISLKASYKPDFKSLTCMKLFNSKTLGSQYVYHDPSFIDKETKAGRVKSPCLKILGYQVSELRFRPDHQVLLTLLRAFFSHWSDSVWASGGPRAGYHGLYSPFGKLQLHVAVCLQLL